MGSGFSLVEVVVALGIAATALLAIMGLLMLSVSQAREASSDTIGSQISTRLMGEVQMMPWDEVTALTAPTWRYFDEFGEEITTPNAQMESVFTASLQMGASDTIDNPHLRRATVCVAAAPSSLGQTIISDYLSAPAPTRDARLRVHTSLVTHFEREP